MTMEQLPWEKDLYGEYVIGAKSRKKFILPEDCFTGEPNVPVIPKGTMVSIISLMDFGWMITEDIGYQRKTFKYLLCPSKLQEKDIVN